MPGHADNFDEAAHERAGVAAGRLPPRYAEVWHQPYLDRIHAALRPGVRILDVGSGARPSLPADERPPGTHYVGLDISAAEIARARPGDYDDVIVGDICAPLPPEIGRFDLIISWQVLEHVASMDAALASQRALLVPGGRMVAMLSGSWAFYALAARVLPYRVSRALQERLLGAPGENKFPTHYDKCSRRALDRAFEHGGWRRWEIVPRYKGGGYLRFSRPLQATYLLYENWAERADRRDLATHYLVEAET